MRKLRILSLILFALYLAACAPVYTLNHSTPVKPLSLPADQAAHYWAQEEWWYYTGILKAEDGRDFGYEVTFFKRITNEDNVPEFFIPVPAYWFKDVAMLGHVAVTDLQNKKFQADQIHNFLFNKSKADENKLDVEINGWSVRDENGKHILRADMKGYQLALELEPVKPAARHGNDGIVHRGGPYTTYYYSLTNMKTTGTLTVDGKPLKVEGKSWTDHEFGTIKFTDTQDGWDWFSVRLDNNCELMLYMFRNDKAGNFDGGLGTFVMPDGKTISLKKDDIKIKNLDYWYSEKTDSKYPSSWEITIDSLNLKFNVNPVMAEQEVRLKPMPYWEGVVQINGTYNNEPVQGKGYVELCGYSKKYPIVFMR